MTMSSLGRFILIIDDAVSLLLPASDEGVSIVQSQDEFEVTDFSKALAVAFLAELEWDGHRAESFYGFDLALKLRRQYKLKCPLIYVSSLPRYYFEHLSESETKFNFIYAPASYHQGLEFLVSPDFSDLKSKPGLSSALLDDVNQMLLNTKGFLIDNLSHRLNPGSDSEHLKQVQNELEKYLSTQQIDLLDWERRFDQLTDQAHPESFKAAQRALIDACQQLLIDESHKSDQMQSAPYTLLVLEDDLQFQSLVEKGLEPFFEKLILTNDADKALEYIKDSEEYNLNAVLADWRLYKKGGRYWQTQGYEVLQFAAHKGGIGLFALTSLVYANVNQIRNSLGIDVHLFRKEMINEKSIEFWPLIADTIQQKCAEISLFKSAMIKSTSWNKYKGDYVRKRNEKWLTFEHEISVKATGIFRYYKNAIEKEEEKGVYGLKEMGIVLNDLRHILIGRRVFLGLYLKLAFENHYLQHLPSSLLGKGDRLDTELKHHALDVYSLLRKDWWGDLIAGVDSPDEEDVLKKFEQRNKNLIGSLCLELTGLPDSGLLPEEYFWLSKEGIDYSFLYSYFN